MSRDYCEMLISVDNRLCCDCYDFGCIECKNVGKCPMGHDIEEEDEDEE